MSANEVQLISEGLARVETMLEEREKAAEVNRRWMIGIVAALVIQTLITVFLAGGKSAVLDRVVEDVRSLSQEIDAMHRMR